jgi:hypothetical protein
MEWKGEGEGKEKRGNQRDRRTRRELRQHHPSPQSRAKLAVEIAALALR